MVGIIYNTKYKQEKVLFRWMKTMNDENFIGTKFLPMDAIDNGIGLMVQNAINNKYTPNCSSNLLIVYLNYTGMQI